MVRGKINTDTMTPEMCLLGWNMVANKAGSAATIRKHQQAARDRGDFASSESLREVAQDLDRALEYVGVKFTSEVD